MSSSFQVHKIKLSLKIELPYAHYFFKVLKESKNISYKKFGNFIIVYSYYTFVLLTHPTKLYIALLQKNIIKFTE